MAENLLTPKYPTFSLIYNHSNGEVVNSIDVGQFLGRFNEFKSISEFDERIHPLDFDRVLTYRKKFLELSVLNSKVRKSSCNICFHLRTEAGEYLYVTCVIRIYDTDQNDSPLRVLHQFMVSGHYDENYIPRQVELHGAKYNRLSDEEKSLRKGVARDLAPMLGFTETETYFLLYLARGKTKEEVLPLLKIKGTTYNAHKRNIKRKLGPEGELFYHRAINTPEILASYLMQEAFIF